MGRNLYLILLTLLPHPMPRPYDTYRINLISNISVKDSDGNANNKSFSKSVDYNNKSNKSDLKKYENETSKNLAEKISDEIIIYLQSI